MNQKEVQKAITLSGSNGYAVAKNKWLTAVIIK